MAADAAVLVDVPLTHPEIPFRMDIILAVLLLALILGGAGSAVHALWIIAGVVLVVWALGFLVRTAGGGGGGRWCHWCFEVTPTRPADTQGKGGHDHRAVTRACCLTALPG